MYKMSYVYGPIVKPVVSSKDNKIKYKIEWVPYIRKRTCKAMLMPKDRGLCVSPWLGCSECGAELSAYGTDRYCHECGAEVVSE